MGEREKASSSSASASSNANAKSVNKQAMGWMSDVRCLTSRWKDETAKSEGEPRWDEMEKHSRPRKVPKEVSDCHDLPCPYSDDEGQ